MDSKPSQVPATLHAIVYSGEILPGFDGASVRGHAQELFKLRPSQAERLFSGEPVTVKSGLNFEQAVHYERNFRRVGMRVAVHAQSLQASDLKRPSPAETPVPAPEPSAAPVAEVSLALQQPPITAPEPEPLPPAAPVPAASPESSAPQPLASEPAAAEHRQPASPVPAPSEPQPEPAPAATQQPAARRLRIPPLSGLEQLRLNLIAALVLTLPLLYLGGIFSLAYLLGDTLWDLTSNASSGMAFLPALLLCAAGLLVMFLWLEPLFQSPGVLEEGLELTPDQQPELHAWLSRLSGELRVPAPERIELVLAPHSAVRLNNGLASYWRQQLVLSIAAQQLAGLKPVQLAGVLSHELARYAQWRVMKLAFLIDSVHSWFARGVNKLSWFERRLPQTPRHAETAKPRAWASWLLRLLGLLRAPLHGLLKLSELAHRPVKRALCLRADAIAAQLIGSAHHADALVAAAWLQEADELAEAKTWQAWELGQLADDRVLLCLRFARQSSQEGQDAFRKELLAEEPSLWASQPSTGERIQALGAEQIAPVFESIAEPQVNELPALSRQLTERFYASQGIADNEGVRIGSAQLLNLTQDQDEAYAALERYFLASHRPDRFLSLPSLEALQGTDERFKLQRLQEVLDQLRQLIPSVTRLYQQFDAGQAQVMHYQAQRVRLDAGEAGQDEDATRVANALEAALTTLATRRMELQPLEELQAQRLAWGLALSGELPTELAPLLACLRGLHRLQGELDTLAQSEHCLEQLLASPARRANARRERVLHVHSEKLENALLKLRETLYVLPNPFGPGSLGSVMTWAGMSAGGDAVSLHAFSHGLRAQLGHYNERMLGQLCRRAEEAENRHELRPLRVRLAQVRA